MSFPVPSPEPIVVDETVVVSVACMHDFLLPLLFVAAMATSLVLCRVARPPPKG
jgi:hypothetical protein